MLHIFPSLSPSCCCAGDVSANRNVSGSPRWKMNNIFRAYAKACLSKSYFSMWKIFALPRQILPLLHSQFARWTSELHPTDRWHSEVQQKLQACFRLQMCRKQLVQKRLPMKNDLPYVFPILLVTIWNCTRKISWKHNQVFPRSNNNDWSPCDSVYMLQ